jgi:hypothetical protein
MNKDDRDKLSNQLRALGDYAKTILVISYLLFGTITFIVYLAQQF